MNGAEKGSIDMALAKFGGPILLVALGLGRFFGQAPPEDLKELSAMAMLALVLWFLLNRFDKSLTEQTKAIKEMSEANQASNAGVESTLSKLVNVVVNHDVASGGHAAKVAKTTGEFEVP